MRTLIDLPDELIDQVSAVEGLVGVSRRLHSISLPHHYRKVSLGSTTLPLFVRSVAERPSLGAFVNALKSVDWTIGNQKVNFLVSSTALDGSDDDVAIEHQCARGPEEPVAKIARQIDPALADAIKTRRGGQCAWLALLLWLLPKLRELDITVAWPSNHLWQAFQPASLISSTPSIPPALSSIRKLKLRYNDTESSLDISAMLLVFSLPSITHVSLVALGTYDWHGNWQNDSRLVLAQPRGQVGLSKLVFMQSAVDMGMLANIILLLRPGNLTWFGYDFGGMSAGAADWDGTALFNALEPVQHSLTCLEITGAEKVEGDLEPFLLPSLRAFVQLTDFLVDIPLMLGDSHPGTGHKLVDMLPPHLQAFRISDIGIRSLKNMEGSLVEVVEGILSLETMRVGDRAEIGAFPEALESACKAAGVVLGYLETS